jgi:predicted amidohydrolase
MKTHTINLAIIQANLIWEDVEANIEQFAKLIGSINSSPHIVILPEMFTTGFTTNPKPFAEVVGGRTTQWLKKMAKDQGFAICGSFIVNERGYYYNRFHFVTPSGDVYQYDKRHLFSIGKEHIEFTPGKERVVIEYLGWRILPQICYDLRFPVWSRNRNDYDLLINVANFPGNRRDVWNTLLKARAIENQCYVAAANRIGYDGMRIDYLGDSQLINAKGIIVSSAKSNEQTIILGSFSLEELTVFRNKFPVLPDADHFILSM